MKQYQNRGFTLAELLITLGIVAIVLSMAVPSVSSVIKDNRLATTLNQVVTDIHVARSEAAKRGVRVILCRSGNPNAATPSCGGAEKTWTSGYLMFADDGNYANNTYDAGTDTLLRIGQPVTSGVHLRTNGTWNNNLEFNYHGSTNEGGSTAMMSICDERGKEVGRQIRVGPNGISKTFYGNISTCIP